MRRVRELLGQTLDSRDGQDCSTLWSTFCTDQASAGSRRCLSGVRCAITPGRRRRTGRLDPRSPLPSRRRRLAGANSGRGSDTPGPKELARSIADLDVRPLFTVNPTRPRPAAAAFPPNCALSATCSAPTLRPARPLASSRTVSSPNSSSRLAGRRAPPAPAKPSTRAEAVSVLATDQRREPAQNCSTMWPVSCPATASSSVQKR